MTSPLPPELTAWRIMAETGLSAAELNALDMDDYARLTGRPTVSESAIASLDAGHAARPPTPAQPAPAPAQSAPGIPHQPDVASMDWAEYAAYRQSSGLADRSTEGMSRASVSITSRFERSDVPANGRREFYR